MFEDRRFTLAVSSPPRAVSAFTLAEVMIATSLVAMVTMACVLTVGFDQVAIRKAKEEALAMDFLTHYVENIKALPFGLIVPGFPINSIYSGQNGGPNITIPAAGTWVSVDTNSYYLFDPDLLWLTGRNPKLQVTLTKNTVSGVVHDIDVNAKLDWDAPLHRGGREEVQIDLLRTKDVPTL